MASCLQTRLQASQQPEVSQAKKGRKHVKRKGTKQKEQQSLNGAQQQNPHKIQPAKSPWLWLGAFTILAISALAGLYTRYEVGFLDKPVSQMQSQHAFVLPASDIDGMHLWQDATIVQPDMF